MRRTLLPSCRQINQRTQGCCHSVHRRSPIECRTEDMDTKGTLDKVASRIVLKVLYLARMGRPDVLWSVNTLTRKVTKWTTGCDKRTLRLISYLQKTKEWGQICYVGDNPEDCWIACFCDASFAGDLEDSKSTSGAYLCVVGHRTAPLKQK